MFKIGPVAAGTGGDQQVGRRNRYSGGASTPREIIRGIPDISIDGEFRQQAFKIPEHFFIMVAARSIP